MYTKKSMYLATSLFAVTTLAFLVLSADFAEADDYSVDTIRITVPTSCTLNSTLDTAHTTSMNPGQYKTDIGTTTFQVLCNDPGGFDVYAIGFSNDTYGTTTMINSSDSTIYFDTGTGQSGNSQWAMKLTPVSGTYAPTIQNGFNNYHVVPTTYTKVATFASNTDGTVGSKVQSTYAVYVSTSQIAGTYTGKVRYTIVHPQDAGAPPAPVVTASGKISYNPNAPGVTDSMGDQSITASATSAELWASNFQRPGYGFAGWSDKFDWVLNANDASGNGTGENLGYHIYGPNQKITFTRGQYSGANAGLSLYAVWVPSAGNLQGWTGCSGLQSGKVTALTDTRDNNTYSVAKLVDGKCWMIENFRLAGYNSSNSPVTLTTTNTNNPLNDGTSATIKNDDGIITNHLSAHNGSWCQNSNANCLDKSMLNTDNTASSVSNMTDSNANVYSYGNYYNWYSATAGNGIYSFSVNNDSVGGDICPADWRLPRGGDKSNESNNDFWNLIVIGLNGGVKPTNYDNSTRPYYSYNEESTASIIDLTKTYPNNIIFADDVVGIVSHRGGNGLYWSSTATSTNYAYNLAIVGSTSLYPGTSNFRIGKHLGDSVRCIFGS